MSLFKNAVKIAAKPTGKAKAEKKEIVLAGIQSLAEIKAMITSLEAAAKTIEGEVKEAGFAEFLAMETNVRPESFKGIEGQATCSVEMRKRGTNSALNEDECEVLTKLGLTPFKQVVMQEMFGINPVYAADEKLMDKVSKAIEKIVPKDFIVLQAEQSKMVVDDNLIDSAFKLDGEDRETALRIVTTMALKPKLNAEYDLAGLPKAVAAYLDPKEEVASEQIAKLEAEAVAVIEQAPVKRTRKAKVAAE